MKNKYKLPPDVYATVKQYIAGYERRKKLIRDGRASVDVINAAIVINDAIDLATKGIATDMQNTELRNNLIDSIKTNCINKNASFEYFALPGISSYLFYQEKHKFLHTIATTLHLV